MNMIEKLKDPKQAQPFGLLSKEQQECLRLANKSHNVRMYHPRTTLRDDGWQDSHNWAFDTPWNSYILKADYEPSPDYEPKPCERPTSARINSRLRVLVLADRYENGEELFHEGDSTAWGEML